MPGRKQSAKRGASEQDRLRAYRQKRDPRATNEPFDAEHGRRGGGTRVGRYVVHLHDATRAHYDLRLQVGGTLMSFAVPRGPSLNPTDKRLAVNTEDHPLDYLDFEAVIPEGNYGAGPMIAWDQGRVTYLEGTAEEGIARAKIDFELSGFKLRGRYGLVHTGARKPPGHPEANQWLLIKKEDAHSRSEGDVLEDDPRSVLSGLTIRELPERDAIAAQVEAEAAELGTPQADVDTRGLIPMLCATSGAELDEADRVYELKLDGVRIVADRRGEGVTLRYRHGRVATASYPEVARAVRALPGQRVVLDGEIVAFDASGRPSFQRLGPRIHALRAQDVERARAEVPVVYLVFDLLAIGERDLRGLPLRARKRLLSQLVRGRGLVRTLDHIEGRGAALFDLCQEQGLEGVVAKRADSLYRPGPRRTEDWVKLKCEREEDFVVVAWEPGRGKRRSLGALWVASFEGERLVTRGKVGSGFDGRTIEILLGELARLSEPEPVVELRGDANDPQPVRPELVVGVRFIGWSDDGSLRHPVFRGIRDDVVPSECRAQPPRGDEPELPELPPAATASGRVVVTNRDKVFWPDDGITKGDLVDYYAEIADVLLSFLRDRPVVLVRHPDGIEGKSFYQWRAPEGTPDWIRRLELRDDDDLEHRGEKSVFLVDDVDALVHIANLGCIPIHVLASRAGDLECGDFFTLDFDVKLATFREAVTLALTLRELLAEAGLTGYPKTSGQSGLHVLVPVGPHVPFTVTKALAELFGRFLVAAHSDIATMERRVSDRGTKVYVDTGQTGRSRTIVAPYSVRAVAGATVSTPLSWDEVHAALDPSRFTLHTVPARVAARGDLFASLLTERPDVAGALSRLEARVKGLAGD